MGVNAIRAIVFPCSTQNFTFSIPMFFSLINQIENDITDALLRVPGWETLETVRCTEIITVFLIFSEHFFYSYCTPAAIGNFEILFV